MELLKFCFETVYLNFTPKSTFQVNRPPKHEKLHKIQTNDLTIELPVVAGYKWLGVTIGTL